MEDRIKYLKMKFIMSIVSTVLIMVITGSLIGMTFAWFSSSAVPQTATIVLETEKIFTLTFTAESNSDTYKGQTAIEVKAGTSQTVGKLVNYSPENPTDPNNYPYIFTTNIKLSTEGQLKNLHIKMITADITDALGAPLNADRKNEDKVPYGFTWYFSDDNHLYTPYGTLNKTSTSYVYGASDIALTTETKGEYYNFCIVFAPERLYWLQKFAKYGIADKVIPGSTGALLDNADYLYTNTSVYSLVEQNIVTYSHYPNQVYYSADYYLGCSFEFTVEIYATDPASA